MLRKRHLICLVKILRHDILNRAGVLHWILFFLLSYGPIFLNLDVLPLRAWDETRLAFQAKEMADHGNWLVPYFEGEPDMWNLKPPLMIIMQALCIKILGWTELALRLPAALSALAVCTLIFWLFAYKLRLPWTGLLSVVILLSFGGYVKDHAIRTGDFDSLLTLFVFAAGIFLYLFVTEERKKWIWLFFAALSLGVLTKGVAALLAGPGFLVFVLFSGKFKLFFTNKQVWLSSLLLLVTILGYYLYREAVNPGYWEAVNQNELGGRFATANEGHEQAFWFYAMELANEDMSVYFWFLFASIGVGLYFVDKQRRQLVMLATSAAVVHLIVISAASTKLGWYLLPQYPFYAVLIGMFFAWVFEIMKKTPSEEFGIKRNPLPSLLIFMVIIPMYFQTIHRMYYAKRIDTKTEYYRIGHFLKDITENKPHNLDGVSLVFDGYPWHNIFYIRRIQEKGGTAGFKLIEEVKAGDKVLIAQEYCLNELLKEHDLHRLAVDEGERIGIYEVLPKSGEEGQLTL